LVFGTICRSGLFSRERPYASTSLSERLVALRDRARRREPEELQIPAEAFIFSKEEYGVVKLSANKFG
jgi:hypothetical protein